MTEEGDEHVDEQQSRVGEPPPQASAAYIEPDDWEYLRDRILDALPDHLVTGVREPDDEHGAYTWEVLVPIQGLGTRAERRLLVITAWEMVDGRPQLVTVRVAPRNPQQN